MDKAVCSSCGGELKDWGYHLCRNASYAEPQKCEYCGKTISDPRHLCRPMFPDLKYSCANCGRVSIEDEFLCKPVRFE
jgi:DNA-directed RNA polymerase subunit RPC12/RpoP